MNNMSQRSLDQWPRRDETIYWPVVYVDPCNKLLPQCLILIYNVPLMQYRGSNYHCIIALMASMIVVAMTMEDGVKLWLSSLLYCCVFNREKWPISTMLLLVMISTIVLGKLRISWIGAFVDIGQALSHLRKIIHCLPFPLSLWPQTNCVDPHASWSEF